MFPPLEAGYYVPQFPLPHTLCLVLGQVMDLQKVCIVLVLLRVGSVHKFGHVEEVCIFFATFAVAMVCARCSSNGSLISSYCVCNWVVGMT